MRVDEDDARIKTNRRSNLRMRILQKLSRNSLKLMLAILYRFGILQFSPVFYNFKILVLIISGLQNCRV